MSLKKNVRSSDLVDFYPQHILRVANFIFSKNIFVALILTLKDNWTTTSLPLTLDA